MTSDAAYKKVKTWDVWVHTYMMLGLLELNRYYPNEKYLTAAKKIGDLCVRTFTNGDKRITEMSNHFGLSATILLEPMVELYRTTGDKRYLDFGTLIVEQMEAKPELQVIKRNLQGADAAAIVTGKVYQLLWNYVAIAKLYEFTANPDYLKAIKHGWQNVRDHHLTLDGGPWGGIARHTETFNEKGYFSPYGFVETCSTMAWIHLNRELLRITGEAKYAEEIEKTAYNALLGAMDPNGEDWCYFIFPNGKRTNTFDWACCKSSGALALEELAPLVYSKMEDGLSVNLYTASASLINLSSVGEIKLTQQTDYPTGHQIKLTVDPVKMKAAVFPLFVRIPSWAKEATIKVNEASVREKITPDSYLKLMREWKAGDQVVLDFPMKLHVHQKSNTTYEKTTEVVKLDYIAFTRGPLAYATGLIDGYKREDTLLVPREKPESLFTSITAPIGINGPAFKLALPDRAPIVFVPYYEAGGRADGMWRLTWMPVAWR